MKKNQTRRQLKALNQHNRKSAKANSGLVKGNSRLGTSESHPLDGTSCRFLGRVHDEYLYSMD